MYLRNIMNKFFFAIVLLFILGCTSTEIERNPYLPEVPFRLEINLNLPQYDNLRYSGGSLFSVQGGVRGLLLFNLNDNVFAWEASCPNHVPSQCSTMEINGVLANCSCENYEYSLATGQVIGNPKTETKLYSMLNYRTSKSGNTVIVSN